MLKFNLRFDTFEYNESMANDMVNEWIYYEMKAAALEFFRAAVPILMQHVDTGMSIASFQNLAEFLNEPLVYSPKRNYRIPPKYLPPGSNPDDAIDKSPYNGELMGTPIAQILGKNPFNGRPQFQYYTEVWHFVLWDTVGLPMGRGGRTGSPWMAFHAGQEAALAYLKTSADRIPGLNKLMAKTEYVILAQEGITETKVRKQRQVTSRFRP